VNTSGCQRCTSSTTRAKDRGALCTFPISECLESAPGADCTLSRRNSRSCVGGAYLALFARGEVDMTSGSTSIRLPRCQHDRERIITVWQSRARRWCGVVADEHGASDIGDEYRSKSLAIAAGLRLVDWCTCRERDTRRHYFRLAADHQGR
jgi:hypothetical protein